jgi:hypothetical protein
VLCHIVPPTNAAAFRTGDLAVWCGLASPDLTPHACSPDENKIITTVRGMFGLTAAR